MGKKAAVTKEKEADSKGDKFDSKSAPTEEAWRKLCLRIQFLTSVSFHEE